MKLYVFASNVAFTTSANLTCRGLGYGQPANIEVGNFVELSNSDFAMMHRIVATSRRVDDAVYARYKRFLEENPPPAKHLIKPVVEFFEKPKAYTIASLPASLTPARLASYYFDPTPAKHSPEDVRRAVHDLITFAVPATLSELEFYRWIADAFKQTAFVREFVHHLRQQGSLRFGAVTAWIHNNCDDVPVPFRWEIKESTRILYDWLAYFFDEITWDRANYSQILHWREL